MRAVQLVERVVNLIGNDERKHEYADDVWEIIQNSYRKIGGIKGSGFGSKEDMINSLHFWKMIRKNNKIVAVTLYKDQAGRKRVAMGTDGTDTGKEALRMILREDFSRAYGETSGPALSFMVRTVGEDFVRKWAVPREKAEKILGKELLDPTDETMLEKFPSLSNYMYDRELGGKRTTKILTGNPKF